MQGTMNAIGILGIAGATVLLLVRFSKRPVGVRPWVGGITLSLVASMVSLVSALHGCGAGTPWGQWIVPCVCAACAFIFVDPKKKRLLLATVFAVSAILLSFHYVHLVHTDRYTGSPEWARRVARATKERVEVTRVWHTAITGLYRTTLEK